MNKPDEKDLEIKRLRELLDLPKGCPRCGAVKFSHHHAMSQWDDASVKCNNCFYIVEHSQNKEEDLEYRRLLIFCI